MSQRKCWVLVPVVASVVITVLFPTEETVFGSHYRLRS